MVDLVAASNQVWELIPEATPPPLVARSGNPWQGSAFDVQAAADISVGLAWSAANVLAQQRGVAASPNLTLDHTQALAAFSGHLRIDGTAPSVWADLSGTYDTADGRQIQLHCNYPHHAAGVVEHLGCEPDRDQLAAAIALRAGEELEGELIDRGMIAALCRTLDEWDAHGHAGPTRDLPLLSVSQIGEAPPRALPADAAAPHSVGQAAHGLRVLDCSRVLAGPVCGQTLASHGADVLRVGAAHLPSISSGVIGTGFGKRNAFVDLDKTGGPAQLLSLASGANVFVDAFRPGALAARGLSPEQVAHTSPGCVVIQLCAFDWVGPWAERRGFDSIVQSTTGIGRENARWCGEDRTRPLPVQALDYATGFLAAFAALRMISHQQQVGGSWLVRLSLLRTRNWLTRLAPPTTFEPGRLPPLEPWLHTVDSEFGQVEAPAAIGGQWARPPAPLGSSAPVWL